MKNYLTEAIGTFFLVLVIGLASGPMAPLAIGSVLMVMIYMGGHISGAHYNPAVTLSILMRGKISTNEALKYMGAQILGALLAAFTVNFLGGGTFGPAVGGGHSAIQALVAEIIFTFALALVVLQVATNPKTSGNSYYGLAIGFTVLAGAYAVGGISGGAFNPAVGVGPLISGTIAGEGTLNEIWIYLVGPFAGGALAAVVYKVMSGTE